MVTRRRQAGAPGTKRPDHVNRETRRPRHTKPHDRDGTTFAKLVVGSGRGGGLEPADVVGAVVDDTRLENADVRDVRVLERCGFVEVPESRAAEVAGEVTGSRPGRRSGWRWRTDGEQGVDAHEPEPIELELHAEDAPRRSRTS